MVGRTSPGSTGLVDVAPLDYARVAGTSDEQPAWSPDGTRIAFLRSAVTGTRLALADVATGEVRVLEAVAPSGSAPSSFSDPTWSPDGTRLAVERRGVRGVGEGAAERVGPVVLAPR